MRTPLPTPERLREAFNYDQETGDLTWRISPNTSVTVGDIAGHASSCSRYLVIYLDTVRMQAHRAIYAMMTGKWPPANRLVDHKDCDGFHNAWVNLRLATHRQSSRNKRVSRNNTLGIKGVRRLRTGRYQARIHNKSLGTYATAKEAGDAYVAAARKIHGEFANA